MRSSTRHHLKEDQFAHAAAETVSWAAGHRRTLVFTISGAVIVLSLVLGGWFYLQNRERAASVDLGAALATYHATIRDEGTPATEGQKSFTSIKERATAAQKEFQAIVDKYQYTRTAEISRYYLALTAADMGDNAKAESGLKDIAGSRDRDLSALAKYALASFYRGQGKEAESIRLLKELVAEAPRSVPKRAAQIELATMYEKADPSQAAAIYTEIRKEEPDSAAGRLAQDRLNSISVQ